MGREELVERIYDEYQSKMYQIAYSVLQDRFLAEDVVHECVIRLMKANTLEIGLLTSASTKSLVRMVATNESIRQYHKHRKIHEHTDLLEQNLADLSDDFGFRTEIQDFLDSIPRIYRDVVILRAYYGYEYAAIGKLLRIRPQTAKNRMVKLRKEMKTWWIGGESVEAGSEREKDRRRDLQYHGK